jgi:hypothetical protein
MKDMKSTISPMTGFTMLDSVLKYISKVYLLRSFLAGILGFITALTTLTVTYYLVTKFFNTGYFAIDSTDLVITFVIGFVPLSICFLPKISETEQPSS